MSDSFNRKYAARDSALDECGIGHDVEKRLRDGTQAVQEFLQMAGGRIYNQLHYDLLTNVPCGVLSRDETVAHETIKTAMAGVIGHLVKWDISQAREMAFAILEDVNDHAFAAKFQKLVELDGVIDNADAEKLHAELQKQEAQ